MTSRAEVASRGVLVAVGLLVVTFELTIIVGVAVELLRNSASQGNRVFAVVSLVFAAAALGVLTTAMRNGWFPKGLLLVAVGLIGVYLIAVAPSGV